MKFVPLEEFVDLSATLKAENWFVVRMENLCPAKGAWKSAITDAIENGLIERGAIPPNVAGDAGFGAMFKDWIFRIKTLGQRGLAILVPSLKSTLASKDRFSYADSITILQWIDLEGDDVQLWFRKEDEPIKILFPIPIGTISNHVSHSKMQPVFKNQPLKQMKAGEKNVHNQEEIQTIKVEIEKLDDSFQHRILDQATLRAYAIELDRQSGSRPVKMIEELFVRKYMPILEASLRGQADKSVKKVISTWADHFTKSYQESFASFRVTGKRPAMVMDAYEIAQKIGKSHGARSGQLVWINSMRFDMGECIRERVQAQTEGSVKLVDQLLLWAALPTRTSVQLKLFEKGSDGFKENLLNGNEDELEGSRGRTATFLRRKKIGSKEIWRLDCLESRFKSVGPEYEQRKQLAAAEVSKVLVQFIHEQPFQTIVFTFGDHGFQIDSNDSEKTSSVASQGGASPEEVLVPAYAWMKVK